SALKKKLLELHNQSERAAQAMSTVKTNQSQSASALKKKLLELHNQSERAAQAMSTVKTNQSQSAETTSRKKDLIRSEFSEIKAIIEERENEIMKAITEEEKRVWNKFDRIYSVLGSKKNEIVSLRDEIEMALTESDDILFLKRAAELQKTSLKDVFVPAVEMDQNVMHSSYQSAINLKEMVKQSVFQCRENKVEAPTAGAPNTVTAASVKDLIDSFLKKSREELLQYAANITVDYNTAHNDVVLSENYTKMSVSDSATGHTLHPQRFVHCRQALGRQSFQKGIHYWEVELQHNSFCGIGVCYGSMARRGPESRLGRNSSSWCVEWFNSKISSWHDDVEKRLPNTKAAKIGVLLHCEGGFVIFMAVGEKPHLIYKFQAQFTEALYPAFWLFSNGSVLSLCKMKP
ncbi:PREDICTED: E3 ubiquitin/ISG15 ligase TRIM25, partial [Acanthisitta chloris]|uniref:E3 ubiquitin/ISG15 ligase TRIM25 n=1 Tax=Acanthisitta chloris TaxID=57068 RepID=UPI0004F0FCEB